MSAGGKTARPLPFTAAPRPIPLFSVVRMRKNANASSAPAPVENSPGSGLQRCYLLGLVGQVGPEPALGLGERDALAGAVILDLVESHAADREVARLRVVEVDAAHARAGDRRERLRQLHAGALGPQQPEELPFFRVVRTGRVAEGRPDAAIALRDQVLLRAALLLVAPVEARLLVQVLRERLGEAVGERLDHDRAIVVVVGLVARGELVRTVDRDGERPEVIVALSHKVREAAIRPRVAVVGLLTQEAESRPFLEEDVVSVRARRPEPVHPSSL